MSTTRTILAILLVTLVTALVVAFLAVMPAAAAGPAQSANPPAQVGDCATCHADRAKQWQEGKHAAAFSDAFKTTWAAANNNKACLVCHTTGFDASTGKYEQEGVGCTTCHKPAGTNGHPGGAMTVSDSAEFCGTCHNTTYAEWQKSGHGTANVSCSSCHDMHSGTLRTPESGDLCSNCHKERNVQSNMPMSGTAQCSDCHMYQVDAAHKVEGKGPTGHTFVMSADACQRCHKDNIHQAHQVVAGATPQPGTDKPIATPAITAGNMVAANSGSGLPATAGGALGGLLVGFAAAALIVRRQR